MPTGPITDWGQALVTAGTAAIAMFLAAVPRIIGFLVILIIGWIVAWLLGSIVAAFLRSVRFNDLAQRSGFDSFVRAMGVRRDSSGFIGLLTKWFLRLVVLAVAFDTLGLPAVTQAIQQFLLWLPNLVVALVVLVIAGLAANAVYGLVRGAASEGDFDNPELLANVAKIAVWAFGIVVAVNQLGIATTLVNTLFVGAVLALALAIGLAFGLGGRETAARMVHDWYESGREAMPKAEKAAGAIQGKGETETAQEGAEHKMAARKVSRRTRRGGEAA
jgi:MFS family permease